MIKFLYPSVTSVSPDSYQHGNMWIKVISDIYMLVTIDNYLTGRKVHSMEENHVWYWKPGQIPEASLAMDLKENLFLMLF